MSSLFFTSTQALPTQKRKKEKENKKIWQDLCSGMNSLTNIKFLNRTNKVQVLNVSIDVSNVAQLAYKMPSTNEC